MKLAQPLPILVFNIEKIELFYTSGYTSHKAKIVSTANLFFVIK